MVELWLFKTTSSPPVRNVTETKKTTNISTWPYHTGTEFESLWIKLLKKATSNGRRSVVTIYSFETCSFWVSFSLSNDGRSSSCARTILEILGSNPSGVKENHTGIRARRYKTWQLTVNSLCHWPFQMPSKGITVILVFL